MGKHSQKRIAASMNKSAGETISADAATGGAAPRQYAPSFEHSATMLSPGMVLDLFDEPIMFRRIYVDLTGSVTAALWLSHLLSCDESLKYVDAARRWFEIALDQISETTGLTRFEQEGARKRLRDLSIINERRVGMPAKLQFAINHDELAKKLKSLSDKRWDGLLP
ncbi:MAG: hypothetical protein EAZ30_02615 [Betaproteobacteria bacterium]|nr:MAG: hypothetical protein EAZ30_02615 [Betaproteobacteria bacterium]